MKRYYTTATELILRIFLIYVFFLTYPNLQNPTSNINSNVSNHKLIIIDNNVHF